MSTIQSLLDKKLNFKNFIFEVSKMFEPLGKCNLSNINYIPDIIKEDDSYKINLDKAEEKLLKNNLMSNSEKYIYGQKIINRYIEELVSMKNYRSYCLDILEKIKLWQVDEDFSFLKEETINQINLKINELDLYIEGSEEHYIKLTPLEHWERLKDELVFKVGYYKEQYEKHIKNIERGNEFLNKLKEGLKNY